MCTKFEKIFKETKKQKHKAKITKVKGEQPQLNKMRKTADIKFEKNPISIDIPEEPIMESENAELDLSGLDMAEDFNIDEPSFEIPEEDFPDIPEVVEEEDITNTDLASMLTEEKEEPDITIDLNEPAEEKKKEYIYLSDDDDDDDIVKLRSSGLRPYQKIVNKKVKNKFNKYF